MSQPKAARARSWPVRFLSQIARGMKILFTALVCGVLPPPNIEEPPKKNPATSVDKQRS